MVVSRKHFWTVGKQNKRIHVGWTLDTVLKSGRGWVLAVIAGSGLITMALVVTAHAEGAVETSGPTAQPAQDQAGTADTLQEIVITARRREEILQDVPETVNAVNSGEIQRLNLQNLQDLSGIVPGLQIAGTATATNNNDTLRGVTFNPSTGTQNSVAFYLNDVFVTNNFVTTSNFDVAQIEVLRGPQGTLRGEPAPSGSLTITTRKPDLEQFGGYATVTGAQYGNTNENGAVNLPIIQDKLAVRLAGIADDDDYNGVKSLYNTAEPYDHTYGGRASVRFEPIESVEANVMYQHIFNHLQYYTQVEGPGASGGVSPNAPANYNGPAITPFQLLSVQSYPGEEYTTTDIVTGQLDWHVLGQLVSYDGGYYRYLLNNGNTPDTAHQVPGIDAANPILRQPSQFDTPSTTQDVQTDEVRIASETPILGFLDYTAGFFYRNTRNEVNVVNVASFLGGSFGSPLAAANPSIYNPNYTLDLLVNSPSQEKEYSEFLNLTFHLPHEIELSAGGRFINYKKTGFTEGTLLPDGISVAVPLPIPCGAIGYTSTYAGTCNIPGKVAITNTTALPLTPQNLSANPAIYNVSLSHKLDKDLLVYVNSGSSWRPPATAVGIANAANNPELNSLLNVQPEKSYSFEGGFKWTFLDERARLNVALYHQQFDRFIYFGLPTLYLSDTGSGTNTVTPFQFTSNPNAVVNGLDLDSAFQITRQWSFDVAASYSNGHLTGASIPCSPPSGGTTTAAFPAGTYTFLCPSHASISTAPNFNATAITEYDIPLPGTRISPFVRGLYTFYGRNPHASEFYVTPSYGILNLYAGLRSGDGAWEVAAFGKNALNTQRVLSLSYPAIDANGLSTTFGSSGYFTSATPGGLLVTPRQEFGLTATYSFGSR